MTPNGGEAQNVLIVGSVAGVGAAVAPPTSRVLGSVAASQTSTALGSATAYTGGILIWNSDTTLPLFVGVGTITAAPGAAKVCLGPGQGYLEASGDLSALQVIAASGSPVLSWQGMTL